MSWKTLIRAAAPAAAGALVAVLAAGCGGGASASGSTTTSTTSREDAALEWARCMREHGVDVEDPKVDSEGRVQIRVRGPVGGGERGTAGPSPAEQKAAEACQGIMQDALPNGGRLTAEQRAEFEDRALRFAKCMRQHGVDMPDPDFSQGGIRMQIRGKINPNDPSFQKAQEACQSLLPGPKGGASVGGGDDK
jgi:hypothetical protein